MDGVVGDFEIDSREFCGKSARRDKIYIGDEEVTVFYIKAIGFGVFIQKEGGLGPQVGCINNF